ncbi:hypothetical protein [Rhizobium sp. NZLR11]|uniref:hypothetical protein n=1 Tax=Rhizobium sp. NZLR11 TaxID=2731098 RepID=UPI001C82AEA5|nr:hypothetical protein [Rhizobium sp. NZLR11]MBX5206674.1 hypothetical protein [Rhizobium sp. NZLR11]
MKAIWNGDEKILPTGVEVTILATDPTDPDAQFGREACWIKWLMDGFEAPMYRSCNMDDLAFIYDVAGGLSLASSGPPVVVKHSNPRPMSPEGMGPDDLVNPAPRLAKSIV